MDLVGKTTAKSLLFVIYVYMCLYSANGDTDVLISQPARALCRRCVVTFSCSYECMCTVILCLPCQRKKDGREHKTTKVCADTLGTRPHTVFAHHRYASDKAYPHTELPESHRQQVGGTRRGQRPEPQGEVVRDYCRERLAPCRENVVQLDRFQGQRRPRDDHFTQPLSAWASKGWCN